MGAFIRRHRKEGVRVGSFSFGNWPYFLPLTTPSLAFAFLFVSRDTIFGGTSDANNRAIGGTNVNNGGRRRPTVGVDTSYPGTNSGTIHPGTNHYTSAAARHPINPHYVSDYAHTQQQRTRHDSAHTTQ